MTQGTRLITWANGEDAFCLSKLGLLLDLEAKCAAPFGVIFKRVASRDFGVNDIRETIRLGLIGGGMSPKDALDSVKRHVDLNEHGLAPSVLVAYAVLEAVMVGVPDDPVGQKKAEPEAANEAGFSTTTAASVDLKSSALPAA